MLLLRGVYITTRNLELDGDFSGYRERCLSVRPHEQRQRDVVVDEPERLQRSTVNEVRKSWVDHDYIVKVAAALTWTQASLTENRKNW